MSSGSTKKRTWPARQLVVAFGSTVIGLALIAGAAVLDDFPQALLLEVGAAVLLIVPLVAVERGLQNRVQALSDQVNDLDVKLSGAAERVQSEELGLAAKDLDRLAQDWDEYQRYMDSLSPDARFRAQRANSESYAVEYDLDVAEVKRKMLVLGYDPGQLDEEFTPELANALERFQRDNFMRHADGILGQLTIRQLHLCLLAKVYRFPLG